MTLLLLLGSGTPGVGTAAQKALPYARAMESLSGPMRIFEHDYSFSPSYTTGGEAITLPTGTFQDLIAVVVEGKGGYSFEYVAATGKLKAYSAPGTEVVAGSGALSALGAIRMMVFARYRP